MKVTIIGGGNAGALTALHYGYQTRNDKNIEIEVIHDPEIDTVPVGQAAELSISQLLWAACGTNWYQNSVKATPKLGILYENFSKKNREIYHPFPFNAVAMQMDPKYLQRYILNSGLFTAKEGHVIDLDKVDSDVIFDCRGKNFHEDGGRIPKGQKIEYDSLYCPVNSVLLSRTPVRSIKDILLWSRHVATPDGWTFVIPNTTDSISYGYLYNSDITPMETAKTNFREVFPEITGEIVNLPFKSYIAKEPIRIDTNGRKIILNGNKLAFLEPMEATSMGFYIDVALLTHDWIFTKSDERQLFSHKNYLFDGAPEQLHFDHVTSNIKKMMTQIHRFLSWHYVKGSVYDTPFWRTAQTESSTVFDEPDENFDNIVERLSKQQDVETRFDEISFDTHRRGYGHWGNCSIKLWYDKYINS
tara:strand:- start:684 stop:1931 length:1248 start_codon:yes stop_codon:yes gene_type:complete